MDLIAHCLKDCIIEECYSCVAISLTRLAKGEVAAILQFGVIIHIGYNGTEDF